MVLQRIAREIMRPFKRRALVSRTGPAAPPPRPAPARPSAPAVRVQDAFFTELVRKTDNFGRITWLGNPIWQNVLDLWTIQETIAEVRPALLIECGTNRGGSSLFFAHLMDLLAAKQDYSGEIITIDVEKLHELSHPRVTYLLGSSTAPEIAGQVRARAASASGPVLVILDSDHSQAHVAAELEIYAPLVTRGSYCLVQDGVIDTLPMMAGARPGPLPAIDAFIAAHPEFEIDHQRCERFLISHHPRGWLRRK
jgi:cephalosporin hydroxylase